MWKFETNVKWLAVEECEAGARGGKPALLATPPEDLGGKAGRWTPEDLLVSAIETCMLMTTLSVVKKQRINLRSYASRAEGLMEKTAEGLRLTRTDILVQATVGAPEEVEKIKRAVQIAEKYCPVSNAVKFPVHVVVEAATG